MKRIHILYSGRVHGVGFRYTVHDQAIKHAISGWVKNTADGKVEVVAEGKDEDVDKFIAQIESLMTNYIADKTSYLEPVSGEFKQFKISYF